MRNSELLLFFFVIYNILITMFGLKIYYDMKEKIVLLKEYIHELEIELDKRRKK